MIEPSSVRWDYVRATARRLTKDYSFPPIPVLEIAEQNGAEVLFADFGKHSKDIAGYCDFEEKQIVVNDEDILGRKMFTIAHELGHWVLHREFFEAHPEKYAVLPRRQKPVRNVFETEANVFAAELLVPKDLLEPVKTAGVSSLANIFNVSREMMENRLKNV